MNLQRIRTIGLLKDDCAKETYPEPGVKLSLVAVAGYIWSTKQIALCGEFALQHASKHAQHVVRPVPGSAGRSNGGRPTWHCLCRL